MRRWIRFPMHAAGTRGMIRLTLRFGGQFSPFVQRKCKVVLLGGACVTELSEAVSFGSNRFTSVFLDVKEAGTH